MNNAIEFRRAPRRSRCCWRCPAPPRSSRPRRSRRSSSRRSSARSTPAFDAKHTPKIVAPDSVKRGEWFNVTVSVGVGSQHPSLQEHFVRYIALYKDSVEIARAYLHPVYSAPIVTFTIALDEGGVAARGRRADAFRGLGDVEEDRRPAVAAPGAQRAFISTVTRAGCWSPTVTLAWTVPRRSCQICSLYLPGGRLSKPNCPSAPVTA